MFYKVFVDNLNLETSREFILASDSTMPPTLHHPPPPTTRQNISTTTHYHPPPSTTTHHQLKYIHYHQPPAKIYPPTFTTTYRQLELFYKKPIYKNLQPLSDSNVRNLINRPAIANNCFFTWPSPSFLLHTREMV